MAIEIEPVHPSVGARIHGLDLRRALSDAEVLAVRNALLSHQVVILPRQEITELQLLDFGKRFGEAETFPDPTERIGNVPQVLRLTNLDDEGRPLGPSPRMARMSLAENWHSDSSYRRVPSLFTLLHGVIVPTETGDTDFSSMYASYEALPQALRDRIEPLMAIHNWEYQRTLSPGRQPMTDEERRSTPAVGHRLVQRHPETGRKLLFVSSSAERIEGMPYEEGRALLQELTQWSIRPERVYTHRWTPGDVVMWDNRATLHRAAGFDYQSLTLRRLLHRVVIAGDPAAYAAQ